MLGRLVHVSFSSDPAPMMALWPQNVFAYSNLPNVAHLSQLLQTVPPPDVNSLLPMGRSLQDFFEQQPDTPPQSSQRREPRKFTLACAICGSEGTGYHYGVASCNGCKTFFRRTVLQPRDLRCVTGRERCLEGSLEGRMKCRKCRLDRCLEAGMQPQAVSVRQRFEMEQLYNPKVNQNLSETLSKLNDLEEQGVTSSDENQLDSDSLFIRLKEPWCDGRFSTPRSSPLSSGSDHQIPRWLLVDLLLSLKYAKSFPAFAELEECDQADIVRSTVFPLTVALQFFDTLATGVGADEKCQSLSRFIEPILRESVDREEFLLAKAIFFLQAVSSFTDEATSSLNLHSRMLMMHVLRRRGPRLAPARVGSLLAAFQHFLATVCKGSDHSGVVSRKLSASTSSPMSDV